MKILLLNIGLAALLWFAMFASFTEPTQYIHQHWFWAAMVSSTLILAMLTIRQQQDILASLFKFKWSYVGIGAVHAIGLYGLSRLGVYLMSTMFSWTQPFIQSVYETRMQMSPMLIAPLLFFIIAPCEEIFWRGFVQQRWSRLIGDKPAWAVTTVLYSLVHIWALNPMLLIAALVLGVHWGFLFRRYQSLVPGIVSHALWDLTIFVILPVQF